MKVLSPVPTGSGAGVLHAQLASQISGYQMRSYSRWWELFPMALPALARGKVDLIHTTASYGLFFKRGKVPLVATVHGYNCDTFMQPYCSRLQYLHYRTDLRLFTRKTLEAADQVVAVSRFVMERASEDLGLKVPIRLIYNGVDLRRFTPSRTNGGSQRGPCRVLFCGNLKRGKRPELLVPLANALGKRFEIHYTAGLSGTGALRENPLPAAARLVNLGHIAHSEMPTVYRRMDVLFMPSVREGFGLCVAEAMACGLPVVAANASAMPELIDHCNGGYLCPIDDVDTYASSLRLIADSRQRAITMGDYNRSVVESRFSLDRMVYEYQQLFEQTLDAG